MSQRTGDEKMNRLRGQNAHDLKELGAIIRPEVLHRAVPRLEDAAANRAEHKNLLNTLHTMGNWSKTGGFDPTRTYQYVANIDQSVWAAILEAFAKYDEKGNLMHDGLLYTANPRGGAPIINRDFFYMILKFLEDNGYNCDMRGKIVI